MNAEYERINTQFAVPDDSTQASAGHGVAPTIENVIAAIMLWSDSTHLASFGSASLWPIYLFFGNQSKYERCRPTSHASHHIAYLPEVRFIIAVAASGR